MMIMSMGGGGRGSSSSSGGVGGNSNGTTIVSAEIASSTLGGGGGPKSSSASATGPRIMAKSLSFSGASGDTGGVSSTASTGGSSSACTTGPRSSWKSRMSNALNRTGAAGGKRSSSPEKNKNSSNKSNPASLANGGMNSTAVLDGTSAPLVGSGDVGAGVSSSAAPMLPPPSRSSGSNIKAKRRGRIGGGSFTLSSAPCKREGEVNDGDDRVYMEDYNSEMHGGTLATSGSSSKGGKKVLPHLRKSIKGLLPAGRHQNKEDPQHHHHHQQHDHGGVNYVAYGGNDGEGGTASAAAVEENLGKKVSSNNNNNRQGGMGAENTRMGSQTSDRSSHSGADGKNDDLEGTKKKNFASNEKQQQPERNTTPPSIQSIMLQAIMGKANPLGPSPGSNAGGLDTTKSPTRARTETVFGRKSGGSEQQEQLKGRSPSTKMGRQLNDSIVTPIDQRRTQSHMILEQKRQIKERDGFCRRVDAYDGQIITVDGKPTYELGNYLGGGVAGVVYEGLRLRPIEEYPVRSGVADQFALAARKRAMEGTTGKGDPNGDGSGNKKAEPVSSITTPASFLCSSPSTSLVLDETRRQSGAPSTPQQGSGTDQRKYSYGGTSTPRRRSTGGGAMAMDVAIEVPASPDDVLLPSAQVVVVDGIDAPSRSRHAAMAASMNADQSFPIVSATGTPPRGRSGSSSGRRDRSNTSTGERVEYGNTYSDDGGDDASFYDGLLMEETVAIKILNPVGYRLLPPVAKPSAVIVKEGDYIDEDVLSGKRPMQEKHVWWLVNPNSRNLRTLQRQPASFVLHGMDDGSERTSFDTDGKRGYVKGDVIDRGSPDRGLRLSLVAAYLDPKTNMLRELPLTRCIEIWGHVPFSASDSEFETMMEAIEKINAGHAPSAPTGISSMPISSPQQMRTGSGRTESSTSNASDDRPPLGASSYMRGLVPFSAARTGLSRAAVAKRITVHCASLNAYIAVPAVPPKYLRWLRQRRAATKEIRNMMLIGRHRNVVHLYEVLEHIQDSKSTMFLVLELVRGGELFDLISSGGSSSKDGGTSGRHPQWDESELMMRKFFSELASGIAYCHANGIAHRDLKPENLLVHNGPADECTLKIADFGLSATFALAQHAASDQDAAADSYGSPFAQGGRSQGDIPYDLSCASSLTNQRDLSNEQEKRVSQNGSTSSAAAGTSLSPLLYPMSSISALGATALSYLTCGNIENVVCFPGGHSVTETPPAPLRRMTSIVGSPHYVAPEIISQSDDEGGKKGDSNNSTGYDGTKADVWSAGVILYAMLFRSLPFGEDLLRCPRYQSFNKWYEEARKQGGRRSSAAAALEPSFDEHDEEEMLGPHWFFPSETSRESRDLIVAMLNPDPSERLSINMVLRHPWLVKDDLT